MLIFFYVCLVILSINSAWVYEMGPLEVLVVALVAVKVHGETLNFIHAFGAYLRSWSLELLTICSRKATSDMIPRVGLTKLPNPHLTDWEWNGHDHLYMIPVYTRLGLSTLKDCLMEFSNFLTIRKCFVLFSNVNGLSCWVKLTRSILKMGSFACSLAVRVGGRDCFTPNLPYIEAGVTWTRPFLTGSDRSSCLSLSLSI